MKKLIFIFLAAASLFFFSFSAEKKEAQKFNEKRTKIQDVKKILLKRESKEPKQTKNRNILDQVKDNFVAFVNVNLVPMTSEKIVPNQTVIVNNDRIIQIGSSINVKIPKEAQVIDGKNRYLMPGLADMHVHLSDLDYPVPTLHMFLAKGVTTIRDLDGGFGNYTLRWKNEVEAGIRIGPKIIAGSPIWHYTPSNIRDEVFKQKSIGYDFIKIYSEFPKESFTELMNMSKSFEMYTVGHIPLSVGFHETILEGMCEIAHVSEIRMGIIPYNKNKNFTEAWEWFNYFSEILLSEFKSIDDCTIEKIDSRFGDAISKIVDQLKSANIAICTTLNHNGHLREIDLPSFMKLEGIAYLSPTYIESLKRNYDRNRKRWAGREHLHNLQMNMDRLFINRLNDVGVPLVLGTDVITKIGNLPGFSVHQELKILVEYGLTPFEAIKAGTATASRIVEAINGKGDFGTIEVGKRADFILANKNPFENVKNIEDNRGVMAAGIWYPREQLDRMIAINEENRPIPASKILLRVIEEKGINKAIQLFWKAKYSINNDSDLLINYDEIISLGYILLNQGKLKEATEIFKLLVLEYPYLANSYDSLGEAYMLMGEKELAIANYEKALDLEPFKKSSIKMLEKLRNKSFNSH